MREEIRMSDDPTTPHQRIRVKEELSEWGLVTIADEDMTSDSGKAQSVSQSTIVMLKDEARWLRDVLNRMELGDGQGAA